MKSYILIKENVPAGLAITAAAHASLAMYLKFENTEEVKQWINGPFRKVVCMVNDAEFEKAKTFEDHVIMTESSLNGSETAIAFKPREEWPKAFKFYRMYK